MIKSIKVTGLQGRLDVDARFHSDINIITGVNGCGKTTLLKLLWYMVSANIERLFSEILFDSITLSTTNFDLSLTREMHSDMAVISIDHNIPGLDHPFRRPVDKMIEEPPQLKKLNRRALELYGPSVFFPTFRRIEGGFSLSSRQSRIETTAEGLHSFTLGGGALIDDSMRALSSRLSISPSVFVSSVSTDDVASLVTARYAAISESTNKLLLESAREILKSSTQVDAGQRTAEEVLKQVAVAAKRTETNQENLLRPFSVLSDLVRTLFHSKGIKVGKTTTLGETSSAIQSELLSAGEKQMLSFLIYNAFYQRATIFIDEPEISLHVDWQRRLFSLLMEQSTDNQFIVATHSPFIYQKYVDKEILLSVSRGE